MTIQYDPANEDHLDAVATLTRWLVRLDAVTLGGVAPDDYSSIEELDFVRDQGGVRLRYSVRLNYNWELGVFDEMEDLVAKAEGSLKRECEEFLESAKFEGTFTKFYSNAELFAASQAAAEGEEAVEALVGCPLEWLGPELFGNDIWNDCEPTWSAEEYESLLARLRAEVEA